MYATNPSVEKIARELACRKMCRFCLRESVKLVNFNVEQATPDPFNNWLQKVVFLFPTPSMFSDYLPKYVCDECHNFVEKCYEFKKLCKKAELLLISFPLTGTWTDRLELPQWLKPVRKRSPNCTITEPSAPKRHCSDNRVYNKNSGECNPSSQVGSIRVRSSESLTVPSTLQSPTISSESPATAPATETPSPQIMANLVSSVPVTTNSVEMTPSSTNIAANFIIQLPQMENTNLSPPEQVQPSYVTSLDKSVSEFYQQSLQDLLAQPPRQIATSTYQSMSINTKTKQQLPSHQASFQYQQNKVPQPQQQPPTLYPPQRQPYSTQPPAATFSNSQPQQPMDDHVSNNYQQQTQQQQHPQQHLPTQLPMQYVPNVVMPASTGGSSSDRPEQNSISVIQCSACSQQFLNPIHLNLHMRKHTGRALFNCGCRQQFPSLTSFAMHLRSYTGLRWCCLCQQAFEQPWELLQHLDHHISRGFGQSCDFCSLIFTSKEQRTEHVRKTHRQDMHQIMQLKMGHISVKQ